MIISEINFEIQKDERIIKERREKVIDEIDKLSKAEAQLKEEINRIEDNINNESNNINEITIKNKELIKEAVNTNDNINSLHQYICELRENIKIICRIGNSNYSEFLSFPELMVSELENEQNTKSCIHSVKFNIQIEKNEFYFDNVYLPFKNQFEQIYRDMNKDIVSSIQSGNNFTFFSVEENILLINNNFIGFLLSRICSLLVKQNQKIELYLSLFYTSNDQLFEYSNRQFILSQFPNNFSRISKIEHLEEIINQTQPILEKNSKFDKNNLVFQLKIKNLVNNCENIFSFIGLENSPKNKLYFLISKILFMLSSKKISKNQIPFKESKLTTVLKGRMRQKDKIILINMINSAENIENLKQLVNTNIII